MTTGTGVPMQAPPAGQPPGRPFFHGPTSRLGRGATGLAATFVVLYVINATIFMPYEQAVAVAAAFNSYNEAQKEAAG